MNLVELDIERHSNPVDVIEFVAANNDWSFERSCDDEIAMIIEGEWANYQISFSWLEAHEALHIACAFDFNVQENRSFELLKLISLINGQVLMGHFDMWLKDNVMIFRQSLLLSGGAEPTSQQVESLLASAVESCEAYFQSFQFVAWAGLDAQRAIDLVMFETQGSA
ncbi:MAG: YbjN domain-containing protein [Rhizobiaceae bacterium]|jgi:hypothetical protein|nr:YbjN domain-containing protein [Rhizobiaceae bacterium]